MKTFLFVVLAGSPVALPAPLMSLLCSLQNSVMFWCQQQQMSGIKNNICCSEGLLVFWTTAVIDKALETFSALLAADESLKLEYITRLEETLLGQITRQLVLCLFLFTNLDHRVLLRLARILLPLMEKLQQLSALFPLMFWQYSSPYWNTAQTDSVVMKTWSVESQHNYENDQHTTQVFACPGASSFMVEFDSKCQTETKFDYLEFTDARGVKKKFDSKVGTDHWPTKYTFFGGGQLQFLFHSNSSHTEWGYKFTVIARGHPDMRICWLFDLQLQSAKLLGAYAGLVVQVQ